MVRIKKALLRLVVERVRVGGRHHDHHRAVTVYSSTENLPVFASVRVAAMESFCEEISVLIEYMASRMPSSSSMASTLFLSAFWLAVEKDLAGHARVLDRRLGRNELADRVLQAGLARAGPGQDQKRQRIRLQPGHRRDIAKKLVLLLADKADGVEVVDDPLEQVFTFERFEGFLLLLASWSGPRPRSPFSRMVMRSASRAAMICDQLGHDRPVLRFEVLGAGFREQLAGAASCISQPCRCGTLSGESGGCALSVTRRRSRLYGGKAGDAIGKSGSCVNAVLQAYA